MKAIVPAMILCKVKNIKRNSILQHFVLLTFAFLMTACTMEQTSNVVSGTEQQILHIANGTEPQDLDPHIATGVSEHNLISALLEGLITDDPKTLAPRPGVAESWEISDDLRAYTFHLRRDAKWSNGDALVAGDFVYAWKRLLTPELAAEYAYQLYPLENAEAYNKGTIDDFSKVGIEAINDQTLKIRLNYPTPYFLSLLSHYSTFPVHRKTIEKFGKIGERGSKWTRPGNFVGNGPFVLTEWSLNRIIKMKKNPGYWDSDSVKLQQLYFYPIDNITTEERMFRAGTIHISYSVPAEKIASYQEKSPELIRVTPYLGTYYYKFNVTRKPFNDPRVRRAFSMSIDRAKIVKSITKSGEVPAYAFTPPGTQGFNARAKINFDPGEAKSLLSAAGYPQGEGFPPVELLYNTSEGHRKIAIAVQEMWRQGLGVNVTLTNVDWKVYLSRTKNLDYDIARAGWIGDYADPNTFLDMFVTDGGNNKTGWSDSDYDSLIEKAGRLQNKPERYEVFQQAEHILMQESPIMPIYTYTTKHLIHPHVKGWHDNILDRHPFKYLYLSADK